MNSPLSVTEERAPIQSWIGDLPDGWSLAPAKAVFAERREKSRQGDVHLTPSQAFGVLPQAEYMQRTGNRVVLNLTGGDQMKHVEPGDFVSHLRSFQGGLEGSQLRGKVSAAYTVLKPRREICSDYYKFLFKSATYIQGLQTTTDQLRDGQSIRYAQFALLPLPIPPLKEQRAIAEFLKRETAEIDAFIGDQEELVRLLSERRDATISHAVGGGLDPDAASNDGGITPTDNVRASWRVVPFNSAVNYREGPGIGASDFRDSGVPLIRVSGVRDRYANLHGCNFLDAELVAARWRHFCIEQGDLLVSASASMGTVSEAGPEVVGAIPYTGIIRMSPKQGLDRDFLRLFLQSSTYRTQIERLRTGATIQHYGPEHLRQMRLPLPNIEEQRRIVTNVESKLVQLDEALSDTREANSLLRERRAALISAAVTGKIDVRERVKGA